MAQQMSERINYKELDALEALSKEFIVALPTRRDLITA